MPPKDTLPVRELVTSQWSGSFVGESIPDWTPHALRKSQSLTSFDPADSKGTGAVPTPISGIKVYHVKGTKTNSGIVILATSKQK
ncbi:hypothetical protein TNCV_4547201 [Trichonephila clavipes]|nr:hypothetical protein TNCV_4547201 [Trichonephila clavipes]